MTIRTANYAITFTRENGEYVARSNNIIGKGATPRDALHNWRGAVETAKEMFGAEFFVEAI
jgi:hypothetical protein